jgi:integrase
MDVPLKLRPVIKKREEKCSLRTRDPDEAKIRHALKAAEVRQRWSGLKEGPRTLTQKEAVALAGEFYRKMVARHEENPVPARRWERQWRQGEMEVRRAPKSWPIHRAQVRNFLTGEGLVLDSDSFDRVALAIASTQAEDHLLRNAKVITRRIPRRPDSLNGRAAASLKSPQSSPRSKLTPRKLNSARELSRNGGRSSIASWSMSVAILSAVTRAKIVDWKNDLLAQGLSSRSVRDGYVAAAKGDAGICAWAGLDQNQSGGQHQGEGQEEVAHAREGIFTLAEATTILKATLAKPPAKMSRETAAARRWIPWICAYTGARVNEITSLLPSDIPTMAGIPVFRIRAENTKTDEYRIVPMHNHLLDQGFLDYVTSHGNRPLFYDPARSRGGKDANPHWQKVGERLAEWIRKLGIPKGVQPNHGWRHRFSSAAMDAGMDERIQNIIQGHAPANEARAYGDLWPQTAQREIQKLPRYEVGAPLLAGRDGIRKRVHARSS